MTELLIEAGEDAVRAALIEDGAPVELHIFPKASREGAVFRARVTRVDQASNGAFLDLGEGQAFLPFRRAKKPGVTTISGAVHEGQMLTVGLVHEAPEPGKLAAVKALAFEAKGPPGLEKAAPPPLAKALALAGAADKVVAAGRITYLEANKILPGRIELHAGKASLFQAFGVEDKIVEAMAGIVPLPAGGSLVIEPAKGATVIDVNGGSAAPLEANLAAAKAIADAIRFQNLGGLIVVDFIDLARAADREKVLRALDARLTRDSSAVERTGFNRFGQVSLKRARKGLSLRTALGGREP
jgi:Ribonuclease G/E